MSDKRVIKLLLYKIIEKIYYYESNRAPKQGIPSRQSVLVTALVNSSFETMKTACARVLKKCSTTKFGLGRPLIAVSCRVKCGEVR